MIQENIPLQLNEEILPIIGYEGLYSITSFGRVWSYEKIVRCDLGVRIVKAKFLKPGLDKRGYLLVAIFKDNKGKSFRVHRLEAITFIPNPLNDLQVNHKDGIKTNNRIDNLEWCTDQKNKNHASENGLRPKYHSKYYGVTYHKGERQKNKPWKAYTTMNKKQTHIGYYKTEIEAAQAYNEFVIKNNLDRPLNKFE
jgi:hypothetical protein